MDPHYLSALNRDLERHWGFPPGVLDQSSITHFRSDRNMAVWTMQGGVVACEDPQTAARVICWIERGRDEGEPVPGSLDVGLYCCTVPQPDRRYQVEVISPSDVWPDEDNSIFEHVFAISDGSEIVSRAMNRPDLEVDGRRFHAVGVGTHPDYRGKGLGKAVVSALVEHIVSEGGIALWNSDSENTVSLALARSVGFIEHLWVLGLVDPADRSAQVSAQ